MKQSGRSLLVGFAGLVVLIAAVLAGGLGGWLLNDLTRAGRNVLPIVSEPTPTPVTHLAQEDVPEQVREQFQTFWEVWDLLTQGFYNQEAIDPQKMVYGAIKGMVASLGDDYTAFSTPAESEVSSTRLQGNYDGIGAYIGTKDGYHVIQGPVNDSTPAAKAGLRLGDIVLEVDGVDVGTMVLDDVIGLIKGPAGTDVTLLLYRPDEQREFSVTITRAHIEILSAEGEMRADGLAYVKISIFGDTTADELDATLLELLKQNPRGLIVDLRGNGGGYLSAAREILGRFLKEGVATYQRDRDGNQTPLSIIHGEAEVYDLPMVVLVNGGSASASEITAGALQDYGRAILIGEQTFGKFSIQNIITLEDGSTVRITSAHWLTPKGRELQDVGLTPDLVVALTPEDYDADRDPQLEAAAAYLLGQPLPPTAATPTPKP